MFSQNDLVNLIFPDLRHGSLWLIFFILAALVVGIYVYPFVKKSKRELRKSPSAYLIVALISLYIFMKMLEGVIFQGSILRVDAWFNIAMLSIRTSWLTQIAFFITSFGSGTLVIVIIAATIGLLFLKKRWRFALLSLIIILGATLLQVLVKNLVHRVRPENSLEVISPGYFYPSFPSGHAITAIAYVSLLIYSFKDDFKNVTIKYILIFAASTFFITVGLTRIYLNAHWFSDVIAGMSLGFLWFLCVVLVERGIAGVAPAIKRETKEAKPIVPKSITPKK